MKAKPLGHSRFSLITLSPLDAHSLWTMLRIKILWSIWLYILDASFGGLSQNFFFFKKALFRVGRKYFSSFLISLVERIAKLSIKEKRNKLENEKLEHLEPKIHLLVIMDLSIVLKLQTL